MLNILAVVLLLGGDVVVSFGNHPKDKVQDDPLWGPLASKLLKELKPSGVDFRKNNSLFSDVGKGTSSQNYENSWDRFETGCLLLLTVSHFFVLRFVFLFMYTR